MKIGITIEKEFISRTTKIILKELLSLQVVEDVYLVRIIHNNSKTTNKNKLPTYYLRLVERLLNFILNFLSIIKLYRNKIKFSDEIISDSKIYDLCKGVIDVNQYRKGYFSYTSSDHLVDYELDFIIRGNGLLIEHGDILENGHKFGLLSLHHADNRFYRGGPWGFWEVYYQDEMSGIILQKLSKELDGGIVLESANLETKIIWTENQNNLDLYSGILIKKFIKNFDLKNEFDNNLGLQKNIYIRKIYKQPSLIVSTLYFIKSIYKFVQIIFEKIKTIVLKRVFKKYLNDYWIIHVGKNSSRVNNWQNSLKYQNDFWLADPFFIKINNQIFLLCERYNIKLKKADIVYFRVEENKVIYDSMKLLISNNNHLSYPFTFSRNDSYFCIPEAGSDGIWLYQITINGQELTARKIKCILQGNYVDPTLVTYNGKDYLFVNPKSPTNPRSILEVYYCNDIINDKLIEYKLNPIMINSRYARSAGRIQIIKDKLIRPSQNCNGRYGKSIDFSEIMIDNNNFVSKPIDSIIPKDSRSQLHHFEFIELNSDFLMAIDSNIFAVDQ